MAVVETAKYAAATAGGNSADIIVSAGEKISVVLVTGSGAALPDGIDCLVQRKFGTFYQKAVNANGGNLRLTSAVPEVVLDRVGTYRVVVPATSVAVAVNEYR